jgi:hypothetical protein
MRLGLANPVLLLSNRSKICLASKISCYLRSFLMYGVGSKVEGLVLEVEGFILGVVG